MVAPLLCPPRFTPRSRTPWGGDRIAPRKGLPPAAVGESWELSMEPDFPTVFADGRSLRDVVFAEADAWLGSSRSGADLLVKLVDAADDLSVQIHPDDDFEGLAPDQCGKPECWYVVDAEPGAALHLGLAPGLTRDALASALAGGRTEGLLHRVEVTPGDFFVLAPGVPHAIGKGVLLVEPQRVREGRRGVTYRFHDWGRTYDEQGRPDPRGRPRALHVQEALAVTRFDGPRGGALVEAIGMRLGRPDVARPLASTPLAGPGGVPSPQLRAERLAGTGTVPFAPGRLTALTVLEGTAALVDADRALTVPPGSTCAVPANYAGALRGDRLHAVLSSIADSDAPPKLPG